MNARNSSPPPEQLLRRRRRVGSSQPASCHDGRSGPSCESNTRLHHCCRAVMQQTRQVSSRSAVRPWARASISLAFLQVARAAGLEVLGFDACKNQGFQPVAPPKPEKFSGLAGAVKPKHTHRTTTTTTTDDGIATILGPWAGVTGDPGLNSKNHPKGQGTSG